MVSADSRGAPAKVEGVGARTILLSQDRLLGYSIKLDMAPAVYTLAREGEMNTCAFQHAPRNTHTLRLTVVSRGSRRHTIVN